MIPEKLYGRAREIDILLASFNRVVASGRPELVNIVVGLSNERLVEIKSGLKEGDQVVTGNISTSSANATSNPFGGGGGFPRR